MKCRIVIGLFLLISFSNCHKSVKRSETYGSGRRNSEYIKALMTQYIHPSTIGLKTLPPPPIGISYFTIGAICKGDSIRVLVNTVKELVDLSLVAHNSTDSAEIVKIIKGEDFLSLNEDAKAQVKVVYPIKRIDSIRTKGKDFFINHFFEESGLQKESLDFPEQAYLIDVLSNWGILISFDDYIGFYRIHEKERLK
ncbi:hypothetical protein [Rufibacter sp. LB8]|nr:hypothetical protein [Rufibacter sp. LB8]